MRRLKEFFLVGILFCLGCGGGGSPTQEQPNPTQEPELSAQVQINGSELFDLDGTNPGSFAVGKVRARVIDPIDEVDSIEVGEVVAQSGQAVFNITELPKNQLLLFQISYYPTVDLATGTLRDTSNTGVISQIEDNGWVTTSIPFRMPSTGGNVSALAIVNLANTAPGGGRFVDLDSTVIIPGDNPETAQIENGYSKVNKLRLDFATGLISRDDDGDGNYDDEAYFFDEDRDCISDSLFELVLDEEEFWESVEYFEVAGVLSYIDLFEGVLVLENAELWDGQGGMENADELVLMFNEETYFAEIQYFDGSEMEIELFPAELNLGEYVEASLFGFSASLPDNYTLWISDLWREAFDPGFNEGFYYLEGIVSGIGENDIEIDGETYSLDKNVAWFFPDDTPADKSDFGIGVWGEFQVYYNDFGVESVVEAWLLEDDTGGQGFVEYFEGLITFLSGNTIGIDGDSFTLDPVVNWLAEDESPLSRAEFHRGMYVEIKVRFIDDYTVRVEQVQHSPLGGDW